MNTRQSTRKFFKLHYLNVTMNSFFLYFFHIWSKRKFRHIDAASDFPFPSVFMVDVWAVFAYDYVVYDCHIETSHGSVFVRFLFCLFFVSYESDGMLNKISLFRISYLVEVPVNALQNQNSVAIMIPYINYIYIF